MTYFLLGKSHTWFGDQQSVLFYFILFLIDSSAVDISKATQFFADTLLNQILASKKIITTLILTMQIDVCSVR